MSIKPVAFAVGAIVATFCSGAALALPVYQIRTIGLTDAEHTQVITGERHYATRAVNHAGQVAGNAQRFDGVTGAALGNSAWLFDGTTTSNIGLTDAEHTSAVTGERYSSSRNLNGAGQVVGTAQRFDSVTGASLGHSAWHYDGATTANIGLTDAAHTSITSGERNNFSQALNEAGQVAGSAVRYAPVTGVHQGNTAWLYDGSATFNIGLTDTEHTRPLSDEQYSFSIAINDAGQVAGYAQRFDGITFHGLGYSAWLYDGTTTTNIGLTDAEHTSVYAGERYSISLAINDAGKVAGVAERFDSVTGSGLGYSAWLYDGTTTTAIGLTDAEHTSITSDQRNSYGDALNDAGAVAGQAERYDSVTGSHQGYSAWVYDGISTTNIGLTDAAHTSHTSGERFSASQFLNEAGQVAGIAYRYDDVTGVREGNTAWLYDGTTTHAFDLDYGSSDGRGESTFTWLDADAAFGVGYYSVFDALDNYLGLRAFGFDLADGFVDLGDTIEHGLAANGWDALEFAAGAVDRDSRPVGSRQVLAGHGSRSGEPGTHAFVLTAGFNVVPEPGSLAISGLALLAALAGRRSRT